MTTPAAQKELLADAREFSIGPLQMLIGGVLFDVKSLGDPSTDAREILGSSQDDDYVASATLQDGRDLKFCLSALQAVIDGHRWE